MVDRALSFLRRLFSWMGRAFELAHLQWARAHLSRHNPTHPDLPHILARIAELEAM